MGYLTKFYHYVAGAELNLLASSRTYYKLKRIYHYPRKNKRGTYVDEDTSIVIEGYPRSANSISVVRFRDAQKSADLKIAHHIHSPWQFIVAAELKVPSILLLRNPKDCVSSLMLYFNKLEAKEALSYYIKFHKAILPIIDYPVIAAFDDVLNNFSQIIEKCNLKFGVEFNTKIISSDEMVSIMEKQFDRPLDTNTQAAFPTAARRTMKEEKLAELERDEYRPLVSECQKLYEKLLSYAC